jgi:hypothetical protein
VNLENRIGDAETDRFDRLHVQLRIVGVLEHPHLWRSRAGGGAIHSMMSGHERTLLRCENFSPKRRRLPREGIFVDRAALHND